MGLFNLDRTGSFREQTPRARFRSILTTTIPPTSRQSVKIKSRATLVPIPAVYRSGGDVVGREKKERRLQPRQPCAARFHGDLVGDDEARIETHAELADQRGILLLVARKLREELLRARTRDRPEVRRPATSEPNVSPAMNAASTALTA